MTFEEQFPELNGYELTDVRPNKKKYFCEDDIKDNCLSKHLTKKIIEEVIAKRHHWNKDTNMFDVDYGAKEIELTLFKELKLE